MALQCNTFEVCLNYIDEDENFKTPVWKASGFYIYLHQKIIPFANAVQPGGSDLT